MLRNGARILGLVVVLAVLPGATAAERMKPAVAKLVAEADRVWRLNEQGDMIEAGRQSAMLVQAADALRASRKLEAAREYYRRAGLVRPWDLETKMHFAEVLVQLGDTVAAHNVAAQVQAFAETDRLLNASRAVQGAAPQPELPALARLTLEPGEVVVGLVAAPDTEQWLLHEVGLRLSSVLGVRVGLVEGLFGLGPPDRTGRARLAEELRRTLPWTEKRMRLFAPGGKVVPPEMLSDEEVIAVMRQLVRRDGGPEQIEGMRVQLEQADALRYWESSRLLGELSRNYTQPGQGRVAYLALVPVDLYSGSVNFVFGSTLPNGNYGVVSYHRFTANFTGEPPKRARLVERTCKQLLSSAGFALGVPRCADPRCARSYPSSLAEHDAKGAGLCADCRDGFTKALGRELPAVATSQP